MTYIYKQHETAILLPTSSASFINIIAVLTSDAAKNFKNTPQLYKHEYKQNHNRK